LQTLIKVSNLIYFGRPLGKPKGNGFSFKTLARGDPYNNSVL